MQDYSVDAVVQIIQNLSLAAQARVVAHITPQLAAALANRSETPTSALPDPVAQLLPTSPAA